MKLAVALLAVLACCAAPAAAAAVTIETAFPPRERADAMLVEAIGRARSSILVQAYTFSSRTIAAALIDARRRGVQVTVIADRAETERQPGGAIAMLGAARVPVYLDGQHEAAHNKVMVFDAGDPGCAVATGSYNFTYSAQHRNAENLLLVRGDAALCARYQRNWEQHRAHSLPWRK